MSIIKAVIISIIRKLTLLISYIVPINKYLLVFVSFPDFGDNSYAIFRYMIKSKKYKKYKFCWLVGDLGCGDKILDKVKEWDGDENKISVVKRKSLKGIFLCYRAKYIFNTVGIFVNIVFRQADKRINMWHGMPIKTIESSYRNGDITICTSELFKPIMSQGLKIPEENVLVIGQPRNDLLFSPEEISVDLKNIIQNFEIVGIWMPTFRRSYCDNSYSDGKFSKDKIAFIQFNQLNDLNKFLVKQKTLLIIKFHPMDVLQFNEFESYSNILFLKNDNFNQNNLYPLLGNCDFLISDYSSVIIDFEILNRPIGITIDDMAEYKKTRGLNFVNIPGKYISNLDDLKNFISNIKDSEIELVKTQFAYMCNKFKDNHSSKRLIEHLDLR